MDNAERLLEILESLATAAPTATAVVVPTTAPALSSYGFSQTQAADLIATVNALVVDVAAIRTYLGTLTTAANHA